MKRPTTPRTMVAASLVSLLAAAGNAAAGTSLSVASRPGDYVGSGGSYVYTDATWAVTRYTLAPGFDTVSFEVTALPTVYWSISLWAPQGQTLASGVYENARSWPYPPTNPGLRVGGLGHGCSFNYGRFVVLEAVYGGDGSVLRFAADFEQHCEEPSRPGLFGSVRYDSTVGTEPRIFLEPQSMYEGDGPGVLKLRASLTASPNSPVSVGFATADGTAHAGTDYTAVSGMVTFPAGQPFAEVDVPVLGNTAVQLDRSFDLVLGSPSGGVIAFGRGAGMIVDDDGTLIHLDSDPGAIGGGLEELLTRKNGSLSASSLDEAPRYFGVRALYSGERGLWSLAFAAPVGTRLTPGRYEGAGRRHNEPPGAPGLDVSSGTTCNEVFGRFLVMEAEYGPGDEPRRIAIDFEQHCQPTGPGLFGSFRYYSSIPASPRLAADARFFTVAPCRLLDTRDTADPLLSGSSRTLPGVGRCGVPLTARALAANLTVIAPTGAGHLRIHAPGLAVPATSTVNFATGVTRANNAIIPVAIGDFTVMCDSSAQAGAHVAIDVSGYFQ